MKTWAAVLLVVLCILFGAGGGCLIGGQQAPHSRDWMVGVGWAVNGAFIGAGAGLIIGLATARILSARSRRHHEDE